MFPVATRLAFGKLNGSAYRAAAEAFAQAVANRVEG
jgi:hypothetical protein